MRIFITAATLLMGIVTASAQSSDRIAADGGDIVITPIVHSSVQIEHAGTVIQIDPWSEGDLSMAKPADLILVTDDPGHHLDPAAITQLRKPGAPVVLTATAHERFPDGFVVANGERGEFAGVSVEAIPAYDIERLWRSLKYEAVYLNELADGFEARRVGEWIGFYTTERPHSALGGSTPAEAYRGDPPVDMMDTSLRASPTSPQAPQQPQGDRGKGILVA